MITIEQPIIYKHGDLFRLEAEVKDGKLNKDYCIHYDVEEQYRDSLCSETADAFVLAVLPTAVKSGQDMVVHANVSPKLMLEITEVHTEYLSAAFNTSKISVTPDTSEAVFFQPTGFATSCSLGVDSLTAIYKFTDSRCHSDYRLSHLAYFGAIHLGIDDSNTMDPFIEKAVLEKKKFAEEIGLPLVFINTNLSDLFCDANVDFDYTANFYNASCILALQKLFKKYAIPSSTSVKDISLCKKVGVGVEASFVSYLGTENTEIFMSDSYVSRAEKTALICRNPLTQRYLDVCIAVQLAHWHNKNPKYLHSRTKRNCGYCSKCLCTLLTFEIYGVLDDYGDIFDLDNYRRHRNMFINYAIAHSHESQSLYGVTKLLEKGNIKTSLFAKLLLILVRHSESLAIGLQHIVWRINKIGKA